MTYLVLQMIGALLIAAVFGGALLWLGQVLWGRLVAPVRAKTLEYELEEARADIIIQNQRIEGLHKDVSASSERLETLPSKAAAHRDLGFSQPHDERGERAIVYDRPRGAADFTGVG